MVLVIKRSGPKIDEIDLRLQQNPPELRSTLVQCTRGRYIPVVCEGLVLMIEQQNVLRFQVRMDEVQIMQERDRLEELVGEGLDV